MIKVVNFESLSLQVCGSNLTMKILILLKFSHKYLVISQKFGKKNKNLIYAKLVKVLWYSLKGV
jgi:hypothetical protein